MTEKTPKQNIRFCAVILLASFLMLVASACHSGRIDTSKDSINAKTYKSNDMRDERTAAATQPATDSDADKSAAAVPAESTADTENSSETDNDRSPDINRESR